MCKVCNKPCHAHVMPSSIIKTEWQQQHEQKLGWLKKYGGGISNVIKLLSRR